MESEINKPSIAESIMNETIEKIKYNQKDISDLTEVIQRHLQSIYELNADIEMQLISYGVAKSHHKSNQEKWLKHPEILDTLVKKVKADEEVEEAMSTLDKEV